jgi:flagellar motility protein MotE (MotC chaperone)
MNAPRILPLLAVAIGGLLAVKAVSTVAGAPAFLKSAKAQAEAAAPGEKLKAKAKPKAAVKPSAKPEGDAADPSPATADGAQASATPTTAAPGLPGLPAVIKASTGTPAGAPVCAPSAAELAKEAGLSPAELRVLQSLQARRGQLDQREQALQTEIALLQAAETKVDSKLKAFNELKAQVQGLMGEADQKKADEVDRLVKVYSDMKPKDAAAVMTQLDDKVRIPVAAKMKERILALVLSQMAPVEAKKLTEKLANRFVPPESVTQAANDAPAAAANAPPAARKRPAKPAKTGA